MLQDRIIGALTFRKGVYADVERDESFTQTAWIIVAVVSLLSSLGSWAGLGFAEFGKWLIGAVVGTIFAVGGFALAAYVINFVGTKLFNAEVDFGELVRTLGLAYVWRVVGFIGILGGITPVLGCVTAPITFIAALAGLVAWFFALKEALDLEWVQTIITAVIGWIVGMVVGAIAGVILGFVGISAAAVSGGLF